MVGLVQAGDFGQQFLIEPLSDRERGEHALRRRRQTLDARHQGVAQRARQRPASVGARRHQFLDEQRVPLRAGEHALHEVLVGGGAKQAAQLQRHLDSRQRRELDAPGHAQALELGQQRPNRMPAVQLVRPVCRHHQHPLVAEVAAEERQERSRRPVGPVKVLDREQRRRGIAEAAEEPEQRFEQATLGGVIRRVRASPSTGAVS